MKKIPTRKHGYNARQAVIDRWLCLPGKKSGLTFESASQSYCWTSTDRSRARLIKH